MTQTCMLMLFLQSPDTTALSTFVSKGFNDKKKTSKAVQKQNKQVALKVAEEEAQRSSTNSMKCPACSGTDHARFSSSKCLYHVKNKVEVHQGFTKASVIKANLNNICKNANLILEIQKLVLHRTSPDGLTYMFANYL